MNFERISGELQSVINQVKSITSETGSGTDPYAQLINLQSSGRLGSLESTLAAQAELDCFKGKWRSIGPITEPLTIQGLALWLAERAVSFGTCQAMEELKGYVERDRFATTYTVAVAAAFPAQAAQLANSIKFVSFSEAEFFKSSLATSPGDMWRPTQWIKAALVLDIKTPKLHYNSGGNTQESLKFAKSVWGQLESARLCLGLIGLSFPIPIGGRIEIPSSVPCAAGPQLSWLNFRAQGIPKEFSLSECKEASNLHLEFDALSKEVRGSLEVPLSRLERALAGRNALVDSAIDLGIALEALFLQGHMDELTYRLSVRGARLLRKNLEERKKIKKTLTDLYDLRSKAVHKGRISSDKRYSGKSPSELLDEG